MSKQDKKSLNESITRFKAMAGIIPQDAIYVGEEEVLKEEREERGLRRASVKRKMAILERKLRKAREEFEVLTENKNDMPYPDDREHGGGTNYPQESADPEGSDLAKKGGNKKGYPQDVANKHKKENDKPTTGSPALSDRDHIKEVDDLEDELGDEMAAAELEDELGDEVSDEEEPVPEDEGMGDGGVDIEGLVRDLADAINSNTEEEVGVKIDGDGGMDDEMGGMEDPLDEPEADMGDMEDMEDMGDMEDMEEPDELMEAVERRAAGFVMEFAKRMKARVDEMRQHRRSSREGK